MRRNNRQLTNILALFVTFLLFFTTNIYSDTIDKSIQENSKTISTKVNSGSFTSNKKEETNNKANNKNTTDKGSTSTKVNSGGFTTKPQKETDDKKTDKNTQDKGNTSIKVDSGGFTTKPQKETTDKNTTDKGNTSTKVDSGSFTTKPKDEPSKEETNKKEDSSSNATSNLSYIDYLFNTTAYKNSLSQEEYYKAFSTASTFYLDNGFFEEYNFKKNFKNLTSVSEYDFVKELCKENYTKEEVDNYIKLAKKYDREYSKLLRLEKEKEEANKKDNTKDDKNKLNTTVSKTNKDKKSNIVFEVYFVAFVYIISFAILTAPIKTICALILLYKNRKNKK